MLQAAQRIEKRSMISELKFLVDGMLGSLSTKLRILGFDTVYDKESSDLKLLEIAKQSGRILLTSDHELLLRAKRSQVICIAVYQRSEPERLAELFSQLGLLKIDSVGPSRCSLCNGKLEDEESDVLGRKVYKCNECGKKYWRGAHWEKLEALFEKVNASLSDRELS
ncbi:MAG: Mut7-C RNAse domain-containing protein [Nitrososphaerales archaeon]